MSLPVEILEAEVLQLPPADHVHLVERLIASLDTDPAVEEAWAAEVEQRLIEIESGKVNLVSGSETIAKLKAEFQ